MSTMTKLGAAATIIASMTASAVLAGDIRIGTSMRMISENGQKYGQMMQDEFDAINAAGGINGNMIELILLNDECKSDKGVANANKFAYQDNVHLVIGSSCSSVTPADGRRHRPGHGAAHHSALDLGQDHPQGFGVGLPRADLGPLLQGASPPSISARRSAPTSPTCLPPTPPPSPMPRVCASRWRRSSAPSPPTGRRCRRRRSTFRSHMLKIKAMDVDALYIAALQEPMARALVQSYEVGIPAEVKRVANSVASNAPVPGMAGDAIKGVFYTAAYSDSDTRPIAVEFNNMVRERYGVEKIDHDFSQAWDLIRIVEIALNNADISTADADLAADRVAIRDAIAGIQNYEGLASGPISFCADPTPQCRDGNRTVVLIGYLKGGADFELGILDRVTMPIDFGL